MRKQYTTIAAVLVLALSSALPQVASASRPAASATAAVSRMADDSDTDAAVTAAKTSLKTAIESAQTTYGDGSLKGSASLQAAIAAAQAVYDKSDATLDEVNEATSDIQKAELAFNIANATGDVPTVVTEPYVAKGSDMALGRSRVSGVESSLIKETGFCWSTSPEPTVLDNRSTDCYTQSGKVYKMSGLTPSTIYYVRAYAMTTSYAVGYGDVVKVITIPRGNITWGYDDGGDAAANARIRSALASATEYWNRFTSIDGLYVNCHYGSQTPTADCSYGGWMRVGPNASYQRTGTILHEMLHAAGVGTNGKWNTAGTPLRANGSTSGVWIGDNASAAVQFLDNSSTATLKGDATHMWPYGINGAHEDTGSEYLYVGNSLLIQALGEDGLVTTIGKFALPSYSYPSEDGVKYYLKNASEERGAIDSYLTVSTGNQLRIKKFTSAQVQASDSAAWYIHFDPVTCYYTIQNVATGRYFSYSSSGQNGIKTVATESLTDNERFQLMKTRKDYEIGTGDSVYTTRAYSIIHPILSSEPPCLGAYSSTLTTCTTFELAEGSATKHWVILTAEQTEELDSKLAGINLMDLTVGGNTVYGFNDTIHSYTVNVNPDGFVADYKVAVQTGPLFDGKVDIAMPESWPGKAVVTLTPKEGDVVTYEVNFVKNYLYKWDGEGKSGRPSLYGWSADKTVTWQTANAGSDNRYMDPGEDEYSGYKYNNAAYETNRVLVLTYSDTIVYKYQLDNLPSGKNYEFTGKVAWHANANSPKITIGVYDTATGTQLGTYTKSFGALKKRMQDASITFNVPETLGTSGVYLAVTCNRAKSCQLLLSELSIVDTGNPVGISGVGDDSLKPSVTVVEGGVQIVSAADVTIYNVAGQAVKKVQGSADATFVQLVPGTYVINGAKVLVK